MGKGATIGKKLAASLALCVAAWACSRDKGPTPEEEAALAAKDYYDALVYGQPEKWVMGHAGAAQMSDTYRQLLLENARMYLEQQRQAHGGMADIAVAPQRSLHDSCSTIAILNVRFADGALEAIAVPMTLEGDKWKMK